MKIEYIEDYKTCNDENIIINEKIINVYSNNDEIKELQKQIIEANAQEIDIYYNYDNKLESLLLSNIIHRSLYEIERTPIPPSKENQYYNTLLTIYKNR